MNMPGPIASQAAVLVALAAVFVPLIARLVSSPLVLFLSIPLLVPLAVLVIFVVHILSGNVLDSWRAQRKDRIQQVARPLSFSTPAAWQAVLTRSQWSQTHGPTRPPLIPESPAISSAFNEILNLIIRDFLVAWYKEISSSPSFPTAVSVLIQECVDKLLKRAAAVDFASLLVRGILPKITAHVELFRQSEFALRGAGLERKLTQSEELDLLLASRYSANKEVGKLHPAVENLSTMFTKQTEEKHLRNLVDRALPHILPERENKSGALKIVAREIVACAILYPVMEMLGDPDFWNRMIDEVAGAAIRQQKLISKVRNVLEAQSPQPRQDANKLTSSISSSAETITMRTDPRQFESFLRSINRFSSLLDARRLKNDIVGEIRRTRTLLGNHANEEWINGEKTENIVAFLDRLYTAKRTVEHRIVVLGGAEDHRQPSMVEINQKSTIKLRDVLRNPTSLSYFMEFMDRRNRSQLVQFWLTVESFKNPLESVDSDTEDFEEDTLEDLNTTTTVKDDIAMIHELYFSGNIVNPLFDSIPRKYIDIIREFVTSDPPSTTISQRKVRRSVMLSQRQIERNMEPDFDEFERSELWFKAVGDVDFQRHQETKQNNHNHNQTHNPPLSPRPSSRSSSGSTHKQPDNTPPRTYNEINATKMTPVNPPSLQPAKKSKSNIEVLMGPSDEIPESNRAPLFDDPDDAMQRAEENRMQAIQAALTDIIALEDGNQATGEDTRASKHKKHRSTSHTKRRGVFEEDVPSDSDEEDTDAVVEEVTKRQPFRLAEPGDLQLSYEISRLTDKLTRLQTQNSMLDSLIKKAELTGDLKELKLLKKSMSSLNREMREVQFQKLQYEQQESANRLFSDRTKVSIVNSTVTEEEGKSVVRYLIEVQQLGPDGSFASGWVVARRYNEFLNMHNRLRDKYGMVKNLEFPGKRLVTSLSGNFVDTRKLALEKYLQGAITIPIVCESDELRAFLSRDSPFVAAASQETPNQKNPSSFSGANIVRNVYRSVADSIDDMVFGPTMLDVMIQRLTHQVAEFAGIVGPAVNDENLVAQALSASGKSPSEAALMLTADLKPLEGESSTSTFSAPICDLILAIFELNEDNSWLRKQAIVIILQQVLGGTIERKVRETVKSSLEESRILSLLQLFRDQLWPGGKQKPPSVPRKPDEKEKTRDEANRKLSALIPDLAANMIGRANARRGARRLFSVLQNRRLNQHIAYAVVDEVFSALFPESYTPNGIPR